MPMVLTVYSPYQIVPNAKSYAKSLTPEKITTEHPFCPEITYSGAFWCQMRVKQQDLFS